MDNLNKGLDYRGAGVDIAAGEAAVKAIKQKVRRTYNNNVLGDLGSFGGLYRIEKDRWHEPVMVTSTDGVGTKLRIAIMAQKYDTIGQDLVNHCVNDILVQGAIPHVFLDYIGVGKLEPTMIEQVIDGLIEACCQNGCALIGGEMAEMPGIYQDKDFDLAGTIVGMVEQGNLLPRSTLGAGDLLIGLPSSGLHTNGYSLARKIVFEHLGLSLDTYIPECKDSLQNLLLSVHKSYLPILKDSLNDSDLHGLAHITGGGIAGNLSRILPADVGATVRLADESISPLFHWLQKSGKVETNVLRETFNLGIGMICVISNMAAEKFLSLEGAALLGELYHYEKGMEKVRFV